MLENLKNNVESEKSTSNHINMKLLDKEIKEKGRLRVKIDKLNRTTEALKEIIQQMCLEQDKDKLDVSRSWEV